MERVMNILLIEDNPGDARLLSGSLADIHSVVFHLTHVDRLSRAFEQIKELPFDVALLDLGLPDSQGLKTLEHFHENAPQLPVIVLTGNDDENLGIKAVQLG